MTEALQQEIRTLRSLHNSQRDPEGRVFAPLADAYRRAGQIPEAVRLLNDGLTRLPNFVPGHVVAAQLYVEQGLVEEAGFAARRALELDPDNVNALRSLLRVLEGNGDDREASRVRDHLLALEPGFEAERGTAARGGANAAASFGPSVAVPDELPDMLVLEALGDRDAEPEAFDHGAEGDDESAAGGLGTEAGWDLTLESEPEGEVALSAGEQDFQLSAAPGFAALEPPEEEHEFDLDSLASTTIDEHDELPADYGPRSAEAPAAGEVDSLSLPDPEPVYDLGVLAPDEPDELVMELAALAPDEPEELVMEVAALAPDEPEEAVVEVAALAPDEPGELVMELADLAPDEPEEAVVELAALAPDEPEGLVVDLAALAPDEPEEAVVELATLAPDEPEGLVVDMAAVAPDEPEEAVVELAALAPDEPEGLVVDMAALAPDEPEEAVVELAALAPDEPEGLVVDMAALAPDEPEEAVVELAALAPDEPEEGIVEIDVLAPDESEEPVWGVETLAPGEADAPLIDLDRLASEAAGELASPRDDAFDVPFLSSSEPDDVVIDLDELRPDGAAGEDGEWGSSSEFELPYLEERESDLPMMAADEGEEPTGESDEEEGEAVSDGDDDEAADEHGENGEPVYTRTLAELYVKQGAVGRALRVLRHLAAADPENRELADRIGELEAGGDGTSVEPATPAGDRRPWRPREDERRPAGKEESDEEVESLARDLAESGDEGHEVDSPFSWAERESEAQAEGPPIRDYFDSLLSWEPEEDR